MTKPNEYKQISRRGRRAVLSREAILAAASALVAQEGIREFSMPKLAERLSSGVMSLYRYFPNRDELLLALAEDVYSRFETPAPRDSWEEDVEAWLWAVVRHFDQHPESLMLIRWSDYVSPGWLQRWFPIAVLLKGQGLEGRELAFAMSWFTNIALGFITSELASPSRRRAETLAHLDRLDPVERRLATELWLDFYDLDRDEALAFGFRQIIDGLRDLVQGRYAVSSGTAEATSLARIVKRAGQSKRQGEEQ